MKTILVPIDFSKNSETALFYAVNLADKTKAKIILLHSFISISKSMAFYTKIPLLIYHHERNKSDDPADYIVEKLIF